MDRTRQHWQISLIPLQRPCLDEVSMLGLNAHSVSNGIGLSFTVLKYSACHFEPLQIYKHGRCATGCYTRSSRLQSAPSYVYVGWVCKWAK